MTLVEEIEKLEPSKRIKSSLEIAKKYKKEDIENEIKRLETSKKQEDYNLSLILAFSIGDQERILKGFHHNATSAKETSVQCLAILTDEQLEKVIFESVNSIRKSILKKIRRNRTKLLEKIILKISENFGKTEAITLLPFIKDENLVTKVLDETKLNNTKQILNSNCYKKRKPKVFFEIFKKEVEEFAQKNPKDVNSYISRNQSSITLSKLFPKEMASFINDSKTSIAIMDDPKVTYDILIKEPELARWGSFKKMSLDQICDIFIAGYEKKNLITTFHNPQLFGKIIERLISKNIDVYEKIKDLSIDLKRFRNLPLEFVEKYVKYQLEKDKKNLGQRSEFEMLQYYRHYEYSKVKKQFEELLNTKDPNQRAEVFSAIIDSGIQSPKDHKDLLSFLEKRLKNEQDIVKITLLQEINQSNDKKILKNVEFLDKVITPFLYGVDRSQPLIQNIVTLSYQVILYYSNSKEHMEVISKWYKDLLKHATPQTFFEYSKLNTNKKLVQTFLEIMKQPFSDLIQRGNPLVLAQHLKGFDIPIVIEFIEMILPNILTIDKKYDPNSIILNYLKDKNKRTERLKKILEIDPTAYANPIIQTLIFSSNISLLDKYLNINGPINWKSLNITKGAFIFEKENYYLNPIIVRQFKKKIPEEYKGKIINLLILGIKDEYLKPFLKAQMINTIAKLQLGEISGEFINFIEELSNDKDQKLQQTALASIQYSDLVNIESTIKRMNAKNAKLLSSSISRMLLYSTKEEIEKFLSFIESDKLFNLHSLVQRELLNILQGFPNERTFKFIKKISTKEKLDENIQLIILYFAIKYIQVDDELWKVIDLFKSSNYLPLIEKYFNINYIQNSKETNQKLVSYQFEFLQSEDLDIQKFAWQKIQIEYVNHEKFNNLCVQFLSKLNDSTPVDLIQMVANKFISLIMFHKESFQHLIQLINGYFSVEIKIESSKDQPVREIIKKLLKAFHTEITNFYKVGHHKFIDEFFMIIIKNDSSLFTNIIDILSPRDFYNYKTEQIMEYFEKILSYESYIPEKYPPFFFYDNLLKYWNPKSIEETLKLLFSKNKNEYTFYALKLMERGGVFESNRNDILNARKSSNVVISSLAKNISLDNIQKNRGSPGMRGMRGGWH